MFGGKKSRNDYYCQRNSPSEKKCESSSSLFQFKAQRENKIFKLEVKDVVERLKDVSERVKKCEEAIPRQDEDRERNLERVMNLFNRK